MRNCSYWLRNKASLFLLFCVLSLPTTAQVNDNFFDKIKKQGALYVAKIKSGNIEFLKNKKPPEDTWVYEKLEAYKAAMGSKGLIYGSLIMPNEAETNYSYISFAYDFIKEAYYYVAIVSYKNEDNLPVLDNSYLLTEKKSLASWWTIVAGFYESEQIKTIPEKYLFNYCPPPPFKPED